MKILIIEDDPNTIELIKVFLNNAQLKPEFTIARDGNQAYRIIQSYLQHSLTSQPPDVIVLDLTLPGLSGLTLLRCIKSFPSIQTIPVIVITAQREQSSLTESYRRGAASVLFKPIDRKELIAGVKYCLGTTPVCFKFC